MLSADTLERDERALRQRINGDTLGAIAERIDLTIEGTRDAIGRSARRHVRRVIEEIHDCQRTGRVLWLTIPAGPPENTREQLRYGAWLLEALPKFGVRPAVEFRVFADAMLLGLGDDKYVVPEDHDPKGDIAS